VSITLKNVGLYKQCSLYIWPFPRGGGKEKKPAFILSRHINTYLGEGGGPIRDTKWYIATSLTPTFDNSHIYGYIAWCDPNLLSTMNDIEDAYYFVFGEMDTVNEEISIGRVSNVVYATSLTPYCPLLFVNTDSGFVLDNSLLPRCEHIVEPYTDYYKLTRLPSSDSIIKLKIYSAGDDITYIDDVKLIKITHPRGKEVNVLSSGEIICYQRTNANFRAFDKNNIDWTDALKRKDGNSWKGKKTDWLIVDPRPEETRYALITLRPPKEIGEIALSYTYTRAIEEEQVIFYADSIINIVPVESLEVDYLNLVRKMPDNMMEIDTLVPLELPLEMREFDSIYYRIDSKGDIEISFNKGEDHSGKDVDYVIIVTGYYEKKGERLTLKKNGMIKEDKISVSNFGSKIIVNYESSFDKEIEIEIFNIAGARIKRMKKEIRNGLNRIEIEDIPNGIYFLRIGRRYYKTTIIR